MNPSLMKSDQLKTFATLLEGLLKEKASLEARLADITAALGGFSAGSAAPASAAAAPVVKARRGRKPRAAVEAAAPAAAAPAPAGKRGRKRASNSASLKDTVIAVLKDKKSLGRKELLEAVKATGYKFSASDPLNSLSTLIYSNRKIFAAKTGVISLA